MAAAKIESIFIYPIKSCRGISVSQAPICHTGMILLSKSNLLCFFANFYVLKLSCFFLVIVVVCSWDVSNRGLELCESLMILLLNEASWLWIWLEISLINCYLSYGTEVRTFSYFFTWLIVSIKIIVDIDHHVLLSWSILDPGYC